MEPQLSRHKTIKQALDFTAQNPEPSADPVDTPVWHLICASLFTFAHSPDRNVKGAVARATRAQKIILDRMVGLRTPGSHPAQVSEKKLQFVDLTQVGELDE